MDRCSFREFIQREYQEQSRRNVNLFLEEKKKPDYDKFVSWYQKRYPKVRVIDRDEFLSLTKGTK